MPEITRELVYTESELTKVLSEFVEDGLAGLGYLDGFDEIVGYYKKPKDIDRCVRKARILIDWLAKHKPNSDLVHSELDDYFLEEGEAAKENL